jgi:regulator of replication initiation timing
MSRKAGSSVNKFFTNYKKAWEEQLSAARSELQKENERLQSENARLREALKEIANQDLLDHTAKYIAREALKGRK